MALRRCDEQRDNGWFLNRSIPDLTSFKLGPFPGKLLVRNYNGDEPSKATKVCAVVRVDGENLVSFLDHGATDGGLKEAKWFREPNPATLMKFLLHQ